jgi:hypothetical protein
MDISSKIRALGWCAGVAALAASLGAFPALAQGEGGGGAPAFIPQSGFWWVQGAPAGRGAILEVNAQGEIFASTLVYNEWGLPAWYVIDTANNGSGQQSGLIQKFQGGQTLNGDYHPATFSGFLGNATFLFNSPTSGTLSMAGLGEMQISRYDIVANGVASSPAAGAPRSGWWWDPNENGRGFYMEAQTDNLMFAGLMYDDFAQPIWSSSCGPMTTPNLYQSELFENYNGQTINGSCEHPDVASSRGTITVQFTSDSTAIFINLQGGQVSLVRYRSADFQ